MAYAVSSVVVNRYHYPELYTRMLTDSYLCVKLYNAALFRIRQIFTGWEKECRSTNEESVFQELDVLQKIYPSIRVKRAISYTALEKLMRVTGNPDFFSGLPKQTAQQVLQRAVDDFSDWLAGLSAYKTNPSGFTGRPRIPHYKKSASMTYTITNQDARLYARAEGGSSLKMPLCKERIVLSHIPASTELSEVRVVSFFDSFRVEVVCKTEDPDIMSSSGFHCAIDFGVDNLAAIVSDTGAPALLYKGGAVKACNQWYNKRRAELVSILTKGHETEKGMVSSRQLMYLSKHRYLFLKDTFHKVSADIITYCLTYQIDTIVLGDNKGWKQNTNIGRENNQTFVAIPFEMLKKMITYKATNHGITVIRQEESYTSKADFLEADYIPVYGKDDDKASFSGSRVQRGLYRSKDGTVINADLNAAGNILRKAFPDVFKARSERLDAVRIFRAIDHKTLNKCNPVERIAAA